MGSKEATPRSGNCNGVNNGSGQTASIVADQPTFRLAVMTTLFVAALMLVPTAMAALKQIGAW